MVHIASSQFKKARRMKNPQPELITIARFGQIPFLHHGFGDADWRVRDFRARRDWKDFKLLFLKQVHSHIVHFIRRVPGAGLRGDAAVTGLPRIFLIIKTADCLPVLLVDEKKRVIAAVHCGWKGTALRVLEKVVRGMKTQYGCEPAALLAAFGPCIGRDCYEVGEDVKKRCVAEDFPNFLFRPISGSKRKFLFDLREANRLQLMNQGINPRNIFSADLCTHCDTRFSSYRRDREDAGRMLSFIGLSE